MIELTKEQVMIQINKFKKDLDEAYSSNSNDDVKDYIITNLDKAYKLFTLMDKNNFKKNTEEQQFVCIDISFNKDYNDKVLLFINNKFYLENKDTYFENAKFETSITEKQLDKEIHYGLIDIECDYDSALLTSNKITNCYRLLYQMGIKKTNALKSNNAFIIFDTQPFIEGIPTPIICIDKRSELYLRNITCVKTGNSMVLSVEQVNNNLLILFPLDSDTDKNINEFLLTYHKYPKEMEESWHD